MKCQCPACGRKMRLQPDMLEFPVRCERCKTYLLPRSTAETESSLAPNAASLEILPLGAVGDRPTSGGPHLDNLLTRHRVARRPKPLDPQEAVPTLAEMARERQFAQGPADFSSRHSTPRPKQTPIRGTVILWTLLLAAVVAVLAFAAHRWMLRPAFARENGAQGFHQLARPVSLASTERTTGSAKSTAKSARQVSPANVDSATGSGELFPDVRIAP